MIRRSAQSYYETLVKNYDDLANKVVMENAALQQAIIDSMLPQRILDIGIGTGAMAATLLGIYPRAHVVGIDFSDEMCTACHNRLQAFSGRYTIVQGDIVDLDFLLLGPFDYVISAMTIHNISHSDKKLLFRKIYASLNPNGVFINGDFVKGETLLQQRNNDSLYRAFLTQNLQGKDRKQWIHHAFQFDMPMKLSEQKKVLTKVGFRDVSVVWEHPREAVYIARK